MAEAEPRLQRGREEELREFYHVGLIIIGIVSVLLELDSNIADFAIFVLP